MRFSALPGFRDVFPDALARRRRIFSAWRMVAERYGFQEYDGPPLEPLELYTAKSGEEIAGQLYEFEDKGGRRVALRPEMTPTLARMVGSRAAQLRKPIRWYSIPQLFRYERQQRGRLREHFQLNVDVIGESGPAADAEVIAVAIDIMRELGLGPGDVRVRLSDRRILADLLSGVLGVREAELPAVLSALDRWEKSREAAAEAIRGVLGGDAERSGEVLKLVEELGAPEPWLGRESAGALRECLTHLEAMGKREWVDVDFRIVRGLAYYTGIVFELFDAGRSLRAICGGGRYDSLIKSFGGPDLPCVGFGMGDVVLGELLAEKGLAAVRQTAVDVFVAMVREEERAEALKLAARLRDRGSRVEYPLRKMQLGKQLELADDRGAKWAVIIGPDEIGSGKVRVRQMGTGVERVMEIEAMMEELEAQGRGGRDGE